MEFNGAKMNRITVFGVDVISELFFELFASSMDDLFQPLYAPGSASHAIHNQRIFAFHKEIRWAINALSVQLQS